MVFRYLDLLLGTEAFTINRLVLQFTQALLLIDLRVPLRSDKGKNEIYMRVLRKVH